MTAKIIYRPNAQKTPGLFDSLLNYEIFRDICVRVTGQESFEVIRDTSTYNKGRLIAKLRQVDAFTIFRLARTAGVSLPGKPKYLQQVYTIYNGGSRRAALPLKF